MERIMWGIFLCLIFLGMHLPYSLIAYAQEFNYNDATGLGPRNWGKINETCATGQMQSPIKLLYYVLSNNLGNLQMNYTSSNATLESVGNQIKLTWPSGAGSIHLQGTEYILMETHWHIPSEHTINGIRYAVEQHLVHESLDGDQAVVGILYKFGLADSFISSIKEELRDLDKDGGAERPIGFVDPNEIVFPGMSYYRYNGSLTTPPCTENVTWSVFQKVGTVTIDQVKLLQAPLDINSKFNARPLQPINNRVVQLYEPI